VLADAKPFKETPAGKVEPVRLRARLQGGALRIVARETYDDSSRSPELHLERDQVTGTYFALDKGESGPTPFFSLRPSPAPIRTARRKKKFAPIPNSPPTIRG
jgi:hypothetical protein